MYILQEVLLVEDDSITAYLTIEILKAGKFSANIKLANDGAEALQTLKESCYKKQKHKKNECIGMILLDINMPGLGGFEFLDAYKKLDLSHKIDIVMLTSSCDEKDKEKARSYDLLDYIVKPLTIKKLQFLVEKISR